MAKRRGVSDRMLIEDILKRHGYFAQKSSPGDAVYYHVMKVVGGGWREVSPRLTFSELRAFVMGFEVGRTGEKGEL